MTSKPGQKFDGAKLPVGRGFIGYFGRAIKAVAMVSKYGAQKYAVSYEDKNWERLDDARLRYGDGRARHIVDEAVDGPYDPESKLLHAAHAAWNAMAYLELCLREEMPLVQPEEVEMGGIPVSVSEPEVLCPRPGEIKYVSVEEMGVLVQEDRLKALFKQPGHFCAGINLMSPGFAVDCSMCKTAIYGGGASAT